MEYQSANCAPTCNSLTSCLLRSEWKKILSGNQGGPLTLKMIEVGLAPYIGLPNDPDVENMERVWNDVQVSIIALKLFQNRLSVAQLLERQTLTPRAQSKNRNTRSLQLDFLVPLRPLF